MLHRPGCLFPTTMRCTKSRRQGVFSDLRCTRVLPSMHALCLRIVYVFLPLPDWVSLSPLLPTSVPRFVQYISYVFCFVPLYRCSCFLGFFSLDISSSRLMCVRMIRLLLRSLCLVRGTICRLAPPLVLLPPLVHGQLWWVHRLVVLMAVVSAVVPPELKQSSVDEQCAWVASYLSSSRD